MGVRQRLGDPWGTVTDQWLRRADAALATLPEQPQAAEVVADLRRLAGRVTAVEQALGGIDAGRLQARAARLRHEAATSVGAQHDVKGRAARAAEDQIRAYERLADLRRTLLARMESAVLALEGPAGDLDGVRAGLAEV